jgi:hypothetical protein
MSHGGTRVPKVRKKCHILFERPLITTLTINEPFFMFLKQTVVETICFLTSIVQWKPLNARVLKLFCAATLFRYLQNFRDPKMSQTTTNLR